MLRSADKKLRLDQGLELVIPRYIERSLMTYPAATGAGSSLTVIQSSASANTKGSYVELAASTSFDARGFLLTNTFVTVGNDVLADVALGGAGSEVDLLSNFHLSRPQGSQNGQQTMFVPMAIPAGTRISARCQAAAGNTQIGLAVVLFRESLCPPLARVTTYGAVTADSGGTEIDAGGSANTKGSWTEISSSMTNRAKALWICVGNQGQTLSAITSHRIDIGTGAAGSETVVIPDLATRGTAADHIPTPQWFGPFPVDIPAGTRLAARCQSTSTNASDRLLDIIVLAFD